MQTYADVLGRFDGAALKELIHERNDFKEEQGLVFHDFLKTSSRSRMLRWPHRRQVVYLLRNAGLHVNKQDELGNTPLHLTLLHLDGDPDICEPLLQAGSDTQIQNQNGDSPEDLLHNLPGIPKATKELFKKYSPGLWHAVEQDDLMCVRKLVNLWCRGDLTKNGRTLRQVAFEKGTEHIIRLIKDLEPSMLMAHAVMAGDAKAVEKLCQDETATINVEFRNRGDMGATPLFYAIMQNNAPMIETLMKRRAKIDTTITFQDEDIPIYFAALNSESDPEVIKLLTPPRSLMFLDLQYRGNNVLFHCLENSVNASAVKHILLQGYPELVAARNRQNLCAREIALRANQTAYVNVIDEVVHDWYLDADDQHRKTLALLGYPYMREALKDGVRVSEVLESMETSSQQAKFHSQLDQYQSQIHQLFQAIESGDVGAVKALVTYPDAQCFHPCLARARAMHDGQPPLIKAVLRSDLPTLTVLVEALSEDSPPRGIDGERDPWYRTALHYAWGMEGSRVAVALLVRHGASSHHPADRNARTPAAFRDHRQAAAMGDLIRYHIKQDYTQPEPDPWQERPKIRLAQCQNHHAPPPHHTNKVEEKQPQTPANYSYCVIL